MIETVESGTSLGRRLINTPNLMLFVTKWPDSIDTGLQTYLDKLLNDELLELKNVRAGLVLTPPDEKNNKPTTLAQVQQGGYIAITVPEFDGRTTMKALVGWMVACGVGVTKLADVTGPTFLIVEPSADGKTAVLAWEYANVCPSSSGQQDVCFHHDRGNGDAVSYELNLLGDLNTNTEEVIEKAQIALDTYNRPTEA